LLKEKGKLDSAQSEGPASVDLKERKGWTYCVDRTGEKPIGREKKRGEVVKKKKGLTRLEEMGMMEEVWNNSEKGEGGLVSHGMGSTGGGSPFRKGG